MASLFADDPVPLEPPDEAELIYACYPRKVGGKAAALKAITKALEKISKREDVDDAFLWLKDSVEAFAASPAGKRGKFTPYPATWFNRGSYDDDPEEWWRDGDGKPEIAW